MEITYGKAQRVTATSQMDRRLRQYCGESLDAGDIGPVTLETNWGALCSAVDHHHLDSVVQDPFRRCRFFLMITQLVIITLLFMYKLNRHTDRV